MDIVRCISCDGFGWFEDDGQAADCEWCGGIGYTYRDAAGHDRRIPRADYEAVSERLEQLEAERMREIGYTGEARKPWEQAIRQRRDE
jgi:hypothetical protein